MNILDKLNYSNTNEIALTQQKTLRILVGVLGVSLPLLLFLFLLIDRGYAKTLESISHYYYTRAAGLFVITLSLLAIFLIVYKGKKPIDFILSTTAGFFALLVVLFPTSNISKASESYVCSVTTLEPTDFRIKLHLFSAVIFLLALACMSLFLFTKSDKPKELRTKEKYIRNVFFRICGIIMVVSMLLAFLGSYNILPLPMFGESLVFWMETIAVESFGFAWLIKAEVFFKDKPKTPAGPGGTAKLNLDTIILYVHDIEKLKCFYTGILKFEIVEELKPDWILLKAGNANIGLHLIGEKFRDNNKASFKADNNSKIVFEITEDIHKVRETLISKNVLMREIKTFDNYDFLLCDGEDPEGNVFQLKQKK